MKWAWEQRTGNSTDKAVLVALSDWSSDHGHGQELCWHCQATIAERVECSISTVARALDRLEKNGFISRERRSRADGGRLSDRIFLRLDRQPVKMTDGVNRQNDGGVNVKMTVTPPVKMTEEPKRREPKRKPNMSEVTSDAVAPNAKVKRKRTNQKTVYSEAFERAWKEFPARNRMSKAAAFKSWQRQECEDEAEAVMSGISAYRAQIRKDGTPDDKIKHMQGWLTDRRWESYSEPIEQKAEGVSGEEKTLAREWANYEKTQSWPSFGYMQKHFSGPESVPQRIKDLARRLFQSSGQMEAFA